MLGLERMQYVTCEVVDGNTVLSIERNDITKFAGIGSNQDEKELSHGMAAILASKDVAEFRVAETFQTKDGRTHNLRSGGLH